VPATISERERTSLRANSTAYLRRACPRRLCCGYSRLLAALEAPVQRADRPDALRRQSAATSQTRLCQCAARQAESAPFAALIIARRRIRHACQEKRTSGSLLGFLEAQCCWYRSQFKAAPRDASSFSTYESNRAHRWCSQTPSPQVHNLLDTEASWTVRHDSEGRVLKVRNGLERLFPCSGLCHLRAYGTMTYRVNSSCRNTASSPFVQSVHASRRLN
jgi:hypothetical protein